MLETMEVARPIPGPDQVLVRVRGAGVNPADSAWRAGTFRLIAPRRLPFVPGSDVSGEVVEVGDRVSGVRVGQRVIALLPVRAGGGYAEYATVRALDLAPVPDRIDLVDAATVPLAGLTALQALRDRAGLRAGERVLVNGASGGVGTFAVQIARILGGRVTATAGPTNLDHVRQLGADHAYDHTAGLGAVPGPFDVVLDAVGVLPFAQLRRLLVRDGRAVTVNPGIGNPVATALSRVRPGPTLQGGLVRPDGPGLTQLVTWLDEGRLRPYVERRYRLDEAAEAHRRIDTRHVRGKLVLTLTEPD